MTNWMATAVAAILAVVWILYVRQTVAAREAKVSAKLRKLGEYLGAQQASLARLDEILTDYDQAVSEKVDQMQARQENPHVPLLPAAPTLALLVRRTPPVYGSFSPSIAKLQPHLKPLLTKTVGGASSLIGFLDAGGDSGVLKVFANVGPMRKAKPLLHYRLLTDDLDAAVTVVGDLTFGRVGNISHMELRKVSRSLEDWTEYVELFEPEKASIKWKDVTAKASRGHTESSDPLAGWDWGKGSGAPRRRHPILRTAN